jgi:hypothetical protein
MRDGEDSGKGSFFLPPMIFTLDKGGKNSRLCLLNGIKSLIFLGREESLHGDREAQEKEKRLGQEAGLNRQEEDRKAAREKAGQEEGIEKEGQAHDEGGQTVSRSSFASIEG